MKERKMKKDKVLFLGVGLYLQHLERNFEILGIAKFVKNCNDLVCDSVSLGRSESTR